MDLNGPGLEGFGALAARRRSSLRLERERPVPLDLVAQLCSLAAWAPCHRRTWPWRFGLCVGAARSRLGDAIADALGADTAHKPPDRYRRKYLRAPSVLVVGALEGAHELETRENRDAVAAGVQTFLLGATAAGLASFWSSGVPVADPAVGALFGWEGVSVVAIVYLGWPAGEVEPPPRPSPNLVVLES
jgi:nitroreductase